METECVKDEGCVATTCDVEGWDRGVCDDDDAISDDGGWAGACGGRWGACVDDEGSGEDDKCTGCDGRWWMESWLCEQAERKAFAYIKVFA